MQKTLHLSSDVFFHLSPTHSLSLPVINIFCVPKKICMLNMFIFICFQFVLYSVSHRIHFFTLNIFYKNSFYPKCRFRTLKTYLCVGFNLLRHYPFPSLFFFPDIMYIYYLFLWSPMFGVFVSFLNCHLLIVYYGQFVLVYL